MDSDTQYWQSCSWKEQRRESYRRKIQNGRQSARRAHKRPKVLRQAQNWKRVLKNLPHMDTIHEKSFEPHFGLESITAASFSIEALSKFAKVDVPDYVVREVEGIIILIVNLTQQSTHLGVITSILSWAQGRLTKSMFKLVKDFIIDLLQSPQAEATPEWLDCLRDLRQNWQLVRSNRAFKQISKLLGVLVFIGLCDVSDLTFDIGQFNVFAPTLCDKHTSAFDVADALFETVIFFTEGAYLCYQQGSLKPLLINDRTAMELDQEYAQVMSWYELVKNGNLAKFTEISDHEFEKRMNRLGSSLLSLSQSLRGPEKKLVMDKYQKILFVQNEYVSAKMASGIRHSPWAIELFGESSQGKTSLGDQLLDAVLTSQNMPTGKEYRCAYNPGDNFMSNWTSDKLVMIFDDMASDKSGFVQRPPTRPAIDVINNQMYYAPKAEIEAKGKCFVEPWIAMATTNKKDLDAGLYSNCPYAIQRRFVTLTVRAKEEFQRFDEGIACGLDPQKVREHYTKNGVYEPPMFDDIWEIDIERPYKPANLREVAKYRPIVWNGMLMQGVSMSTCLQWAIEDFDNHIKNQKALLKSMRERECKMEICPREGCKHLKGNCPYHLSEQFGRETVKSFWKLWYRSKKFKGPIDAFYDRVDHTAANLLYDKGMKFLDQWDWIKVIPAPILDHEHAPAVMRWLYSDRLNTDYKRETRRAWITLVLMMILCCTVFTPFVAVMLCFILSVEFLFRQRNLVERVEKNLYDELKNRNLGIHPMLQRYRDKYVKWICGVSIGIAALYGLAKAYRAFKKEDSQGSLEPKTKQEVKKRDNEVNVWTDVVKKDLPISDKSKRMSPEHMNNIVKKSLLYGSIHLADDETAMVNGLMLGSNVIMIPDHYFEQFGDQLNCTFRKRNPEASGGKFAGRLHKKASYLIPGSDIRICYIPTGGSFNNDIIEYFPKGEMPSVPFQMHWRQKDGEMLIAKGMTDPGMVTTTKTFKGGLYKNLTIDTFNGLCGAVLVSDTNGCTIMGIHLGGTSGTPRGCYGSVTQQEIHTAFSELRKIEGVIISGGAGEFRTEILGVQFTRADPLHKKSALNYLPENSQIEYFGSCSGRAISKSEVKVTPISEHITDVCNVPNIYRGPKMHPEWYGWQTCLANMAVPATPFPHDVLEIAIKDYKEPLIDIFQSDLWCNTRPLTDHENLCGIPGEKFMDAIKLNTSIGYPLSGPKREFVTELEPTEEKPNNRILDDKIMEEIKRMEDCYRKGKRAYPIAKACKKDEILAKDKCRIFYGNSIALTFLIRKYFLPLLRVLQMNPLVSECAVGINSHGTEWEEFDAFVKKFGLERLFGGDYGKYDQLLASQEIFAALRLLIDLARLVQYTEEHLTIMEAMTGDIVFAYIAFNGDLIGLTEGSHISGNSLTVIINGICGSLNMRVYFYTMNPCASFETRKKFRDYIAAMTYGDDNIGSVSPEINNFTIKGFSKFLAEYGQVYTMPDKESELLDFLPPEEFEFLKRQSVYHPKLGVHVGALADKSIYKSLHCFMRGKNCPLTEEHASAQNIDGALREWFNHGEAKYELQRKQMTEVAKRAGISHMCTGLNLNYNDRVVDWYEKYGEDTRTFNSVNPII